LGIFSIGNSANVARLVAQRRDGRELQRRDCYDFPISAQAPWSIICYEVKVGILQSPILHTNGSSVYRWIRYRHPGRLGSPVNLLFSAILSLAKFSD